LEGKRWEGGSSDIGLRNKVQGTRYKEQDTRNKEQGTRYKGQGTRHKVQGTRYRGQGVGDKVQVRDSLD